MAGAEQARRLRGTQVCGARIRPQTMYVQTSRQTTRDRI